MVKPKSFSEQEVNAAIKQYLKESNTDIRAYKNNTKILSTLKRERLYFLLALIFGLLFNLGASAIDNLMQIFSSKIQPDPLYFTYASVVIGLMIAVIVWMIGKIKDFDNYIKLVEKEDV